MVYMGGVVYTFYSSFWHPPHTHTHIYLQVFHTGQATGDAGEAVVVQVKLSQAGQVRERTTLNMPDMIRPKTQPDLRQKKINIKRD